MLITMLGTLIRQPQRPARNLEAMLCTSPTLGPEEAPEIAAFIRACIQLDPAARLEAEDISCHDWLMNAFMPDNKWPGWKVIRASHNADMFMRAQDG